MTDKNELSEVEDSKIKTVFIVEDDTEIGNFLVQALKEETPYQAVLATDGFQALKMVRTLMPDLFVLDYQLPSMNGIELYDHIHATEELKHIPALFMSANLPTKELEKRRVYSIKKPFDLDELLHRIKTLLEEPPSRS